MSWMKVTLVLGMLAIGAAVLIFGGESIGKETMAGIVGLIGVIVGGVAVPSRGVHPDPAKRTTWAGPPLVLLALLPALMVGCGALTGARITADEVASDQQPQNQATMDNAGEQRAQFIGLAPTQLKQDADGSWLTTPGQGAVITFNPQTKQMYVWSPKDVRMTDVQIGDTKIGELNANLSPVIEAETAQVVAYLSTLQGMSADQRLTEIERALAAKEITSDMASAAIAITKLFAPVP